MRNEVETDARGTANLIERIHATSLRGRDGRLQWSRELVQNELDAGATRIEIDGFDYGAGVELMRVSGNGSGMTVDRLRDRLTSIGVPEDRSTNFGVGARFATLPENHAGVSWISVVPEDPEGALVTIHYERGAFSFMHRDDADGDRIYDDETGELAVVFQPWDGSVPAYISKAKHGTAVLLHGSRSDESTFSDRRARDVFAFLCRRYWSLPAKITIAGANLGSGGGSKALSVVPLSDWLDRYAEARGTVEVPGASIEWSVLTPLESRRGGGPVRHLAADFVGVRVGNEIVERRDRQELERFGIYGKSARGRVVLVVEPNGAELDLTRSRAVTAAGEDLPWRAWREAFVAQMPDEIRAILPSAATLEDFEAELERLFDDAFMDRVNASLAHVSSRRGKLRVVDGETDYTGKPEAGEPNENPTPRRRREAEDPSPEPAPAKPRKTARRAQGGKLGREVERPAIPTPRYIYDREDWPELFGNATFAGYISSSNEAFLYCPDPIVEETERGAASRHRGKPADMVRLAVERGLMIELASKIVHALVRFRRDRAWTEDDLESVLDARSLSMSLLGFQALDAFVDRTVEDLEREAREA